MIGESRGKIPAFRNRSEALGGHLDDLEQAPRVADQDPQIVELAPRFADQDPEVRSWLRMALREHLESSNEPPGGGRERLEAARAPLELAR